MESMIFCGKFSSFGEKYFEKKYNHKFLVMENNSPKNRK
jgi:hypothetical protein